MSHKQIQFSPNHTVESNDSHFALSAMSIPSPDVYLPRSQAHDIFIDNPGSRDGFSSSFYAHTPLPSEFPMVPPGYRPESNIISAGELPFVASDRPTDVLGDITATDSEFSDQIEREVREVILGQMESYSRKVFIGSVPCDASAVDLQEFFSKFGPLTVDYRTTPSLDQCGYAFVVFEHASSVNKLVDACLIGEDSTHVILLPCRMIKNAGKFLVIRAWRTSDGYWKNSLIKDRLDNRFSIFVGGVPRVCSAVSLAQVFDHEFGSVGKVAIELEPLTGFPKGVAKITFSKRDAYMNAINRKRVKLSILNPVKEVGVKPYLRSSMRCEICCSMPTDKFCAGPECHLYICDTCWSFHCLANSHLLHTVMYRSDNSDHQIQNATFGVRPPQLGFQPTLRHANSNAEMLAGFYNVLTPSSSYLANTPRTNASDGSRRSATIETNYNHIDASTRFGPSCGFRNVTDFVNMQNHSIDLSSNHNRHHNHHNMLNSFPNHRTPIGHIVSQEIIQDYSLRVFIGGLPRGISADDLTVFFTSFGHVDVDIDPSGETKHAFLRFARLAAVRTLVAQCQLVEDRLILAFYVESKRVYISVHVRPWLKHNRVWMNGCLPINNDINSASTRYSIFIGGIPRSTTAAELAQVVQSHFGDVASLMINVDSVFEYPRGSARAVFLTKDSYVRAIKQKYLIVFNGEQPRQVELKPFVDSKMPCENCGRGSFQSFCPEISCLKYLCKICWEVCHVYKPDHRPMLTWRITCEENRAASKRRGDKIVCPPKPYGNDDDDPIEHEGPSRFLNAPGPSSVFNMLLSNFDHMNLSSPSAPKDFGLIGSGRPN